MRDYELTPFTTRDGTKLWRLKTPGKRDILMNVEELGIVSDMIREVINAEETITRMA